MQRSIIEYCSEHDGYKCGYCKKPNSNYSHGMWAHMMTVQDYQDLIDRGWRRSGKYCYKPLLDVICCPMYTIRCRALEFKTSKSQKKVMKRFNKFLMGQEEISGESKVSGSNEDMTVDTEGREEFVESRRRHQDINIAGVDISSIGQPVHYFPKETSEKVSAQNQTTSNTKFKDKKEDVAGPDPTKAPCKKAKQARRERKLEKLKKKGIDVSNIDNSNKNKEKQLEDFINELQSNVKRNLEIKLVRTTPPSAEWLATAKETHQLYVKYQMAVHGDRPEKCTESQFNGFLVQSPLMEEHSEVGPPCGYGSFHQQYWLDGKLIAVGVLDILPKCVSSVYFMYDPQHMNLTLGTYGALREIAFTRHLHTLCPELKYYYIGFYIHSCQKMRYKGNFYPSDLLCPETYKWFPLQDCTQKLDIAPYSRFDPDIDSIDEFCGTDSDMKHIPVLYKGEVIPFNVYKNIRKNVNIEEVVEYARLVGTKTIRRMIMARL
ncbi:arginyl-tRNA--protein transferase 1 isoform X1 [Pararge aegeria]|uniref:arginyl-tRNA--protein transferase 1 isoform X1 n=1 Tax=Pararge aegeria TaxID=116150 RepID=UPI0019D1ED20|nr:arginyl-tRNA--protein transferase 1 isoform X1 [Pararge aegeria]